MKVYKGCDKLEMLIMADWDWDYDLQEDNTF